MDSLKAALIKLFLHLCALLPLSWARGLGRNLVRLYWPVGGRSRKVTQRNIELAFPQLAAAEQTQLAKRSLGATGELVAEMGHVWLKPWEQVQGLIKFGNIIGTGSGQIPPSKHIERAILTAMIEPLSDDEDVKVGLMDLVTAVFG